MSNTEEVLALLVDPVTIIAGGAVVLLLATSVKEWRSRRNKEARSKRSSLSDTLIHLRPHEWIGGGRGEGQPLRRWPHIRKKVA